MVDTEALDLFARDELELKELRSITCGFTQADWEFIICAVKPLALAMGI